MATKRFRCFSGPNGSGKSTLINEINKNFDLGVTVNADEIESNLNSKRFLYLGDFLEVDINQNDWSEFLATYKKVDKRIDGSNMSSLTVNEGYLVSQDKVNSYQAAIVASFLRDRLLKTRNSFSFETVMSHPSKVDFLKKAANEGFKTYLYFICTRDPRINEQRVRNRVEIGGHQVSKDKIQKRYYASLSLLKEAFLIADRSFVIDSSTDKRNLILEKKDSEVIIHSTEIPGWVDKYLLDLIS